MRCARDAAPLIAVDQEGGRVARLRDGVEPMPPMMALGAADEIELARARGRADRHSTCAAPAARWISRRCSIWRCRSPQHGDRNALVRRRSAARRSAGLRVRAGIAARRHDSVLQTLSRTRRDADRLARGATGDRRGRGDAARARSRALCRGSARRARDDERARGGACIRSGESGDAVARASRPICCAASSDSEARS